MERPTCGGRRVGLLAIAATFATLAGCRGMAPPDCCPPGGCSCGMAVPIQRRAIGCRGSATVQFGGNEGLEPEYVPPRFHPVPTRPVFAPAGFLGGAICEDPSEGKPMATSNARPLEIEVLPPAPVPEEILNPTADPGPQDRMTRAPRRLVDRPTETSWLFPVSPRRTWGRLAKRPNHHRS